MLTLFVVLSFGCGSASDDAEGVCRIASEVVADSTLGADQWSQVGTSRIMELDLTSDIRTALEAIQYAEPESAYLLLQQAFAEKGVEDWQCPAFGAMMRGEALARN